MHKKHIYYIILFLIITCFVKNTAAYNDTITHPDITKKAAEYSQINQYLKNNLGFEDGLETNYFFNGKKFTILNLLREGAKLEDDPNCRASNHFHNPLKVWGESYLTDDDFLSNRYGWLIREYCEAEGWAYEARKSNITWATGFLATDGSQYDFSSTEPEYAPNTWDKAREYYYNALTANAMEDREDNFALTFKAVGQVVHLLEDMAVPAHVRNDFVSHLKYNQIDPDAETWVGKSGVGSRYEYFVKIRPALVAATPVYPTFTNLRLTDFWDTEQYVDGGDPPTGTAIGLAEYSNSNFLSSTTIFKSSLNPWHYFQHPAWNSVVEYDEIIDGEKRTYLRKLGSGETDGSKIGYGERIEHLARIGWLYKWIPPFSVVRVKALMLDDVVYLDYAEKLLPRAVGYSAGLLDYFFRGEIEISLPASGVYVLTDDPDQGFTSITLRAENVTPDNEAMTAGSIELVVKYKLALEDPFQFVPVAKSDFVYQVFSENGGISSIPIDSTVELTFDMDENPIPINAVDIYLQVVYKGKLGMEDEAVAVGFKDISEPTPIDIFSNTDKICLYGSWYDAGIPEAIALVDANGDGTAYGSAEWDVYLHEQKDIYIKFSPDTDPQYASPTEYNSYISYLSAGNFVRAVFILTDYQFNYSFYTSWVKKDTDDYWGHPDSLQVYPGTAITNQENIYPGLFTIRGNDMWWGGGLIYIDTPYPEGSSACSYDSL